MEGLLQELAKKFVEEIESTIAVIAFIIYLTINRKSNKNEDTKDSVQDALINYGQRISTVETKIEYTEKEIEGIKNVLEKK